MTHLMEVCFIVGALFLASNLWFFFRVLRPIQKLSAQAAQLSQGKLDALEDECGGIGEISELRRAMVGMVGHVRRAQEQSRAYAEQLADGQEQERKRLAHELHDDTIQSIIGVTQALDMIKSWMKTDSARAIQSLQQLREQTIEIVTNLRNLIGDLRPPALEELGLITALEMLTQNITHPPVSLQVQGTPRRLDENRELALFRAAQEALNNSLKHATPEHIQLAVDYDSAGVTLRIRDDGTGFQPPAQLGELAFHNHYGLIGIQERIASLGGWMKFDSNIRQGTTLTVHLPDKEPPQPTHLVRDPVCRALIEPHQAYGSIVYEGETYYFCCPVCQGAFQKDSHLYLKTPPA